MVFGQKDTLLAGAAGREARLWNSLSRKTIRLTKESVQHKMQLKKDQMDTASSSFNIIHKSSKFQDYFVRQISTSRSKELLNG